MPDKRAAMRIRAATARDLHRCAVITTTSLIDDATYDYMWPKRRQYPEDNFVWQQLKLEGHLYDKKAVFLVVEIDGDRLSPGQDEPDTATATATATATGAVRDTAVPIKEPTQRQTQSPESTIISYGIWIRMGCDAAARERMAKKNTWMNALDATTTAVQRWSIDQKYQRRDGDPARFDALTAATKEVKRKYFSDSPDWWSLELLVTDRLYRRQGAASGIVRWGTDAGDEEGVFCGVEASVMGAPLYQSLGFQKLDTWVVQVPGDKESLAYDVMRREPKVSKANR